MIEFQEVTKSFDEEVVLKDISFKVQRGETLIILGESGSGKSTVLKLILGLIKPDSGRILVEKHLGFVDLDEAIDKMPAELSGGMKRRVGIARALVGSPEIILYDEPTAGLDPITKRTIVELMIKLRDMEGVTSIFVTHDLHAASIIATEYAAFSEDGSIGYTSDSGSGTLSAINFIMLMDGSICFHGGYRELTTSEVPYVKLFVH